MSKKFSTTTADYLDWEQMLNLIHKLSNWNNIMSYLLINRKLFFLHVCTSIKFSFSIPFISNKHSLRIHYAFN